MSGLSPTDPLIGVRLGDYVLQDLLGRGGVARVYRGLDPNLGRLAAVKVVEVPPEDSGEDRTIERFRLEARAIASFDHPNIVSVYQYGEAGNLFFIAMKLVRGQSLAQVIKEARRAGRAIPPQRILEIVRDVGDALDYAHARGIIHRDVKPSNILFDAEASSRAILTDFGLAMEIGGATTLGTAFGTPRYISPEQAMFSQQAVPQSDIYSLGVVVYEMLTGQAPFQDESPMSVALAHITNQPPSLRSLCPTIPLEVEAVVLRALAKEPEARYATAGDFYRALEEAYFSAGIELPTLTVAPEPAKAGGRAKEKGKPVPASPAVMPVTWPTAALAVAPAAVSAVAPAVVPAAPGTGLRRARRVSRLVALILVIGGLAGLWWFNGETAEIMGMLQAVATRLLGGEPSLLQEIPPDVELRLELIYDADRFALRNLTAYRVPLDGLTLEWGDGAPYTLTGAAFGGPLPAGQCAWMRLLEKGTLRPPEGCPVTAHYLRLLDAPEDLFWVGRGSFAVRVNGESVATCPAESGRCRFVLPR